MINSHNPVDNNVASDTLYVDDNRLTANILIANITDNDPSAALDCTGPWYYNCSIVSTDSKRSKRNKMCV